MKILKWRKIIGPLLFVGKMCLFLFVVKKMCIRENFKKKMKRGRSVESHEIEENNPNFNDLTELNPVTINTNENSTELNEIILSDIENAILLILQRIPSSSSSSSSSSCNFPKIFFKHQLYPIINNQTEVFLSFSFSHFLHKFLSFSLHFCFFLSYYLKKKRLKKKLINYKKIKK